MESTTPTHLMTLSSLLIILFLSHSSVASATSKLIEDICNSLKNPHDDCVNALMIDPASAHADLKTLANITLKLGISNATESENFIKKMIDSKKTKASLIKPLKYCLSLYRNVRNSFAVVMKEYEEDPMTASYDVKVSGDYPDQCDEELLRKKARIPSVTNRNKFLRLYSYIGFVIISRLDTH